MKIAKKIVVNLSNTFVSKWFVLIVDLALTLISFGLALLIRFNFELDTVLTSEHWNSTYIVIGVYTTFFLIFKSYAGVIRHTSLHDGIKILQSTTASFVVLISLSLIMEKLFLLSDDLQYNLHVSLSIVCIHYLLTNFILLVSRLIFKTIYFKLVSSRRYKKNKNVLIYGAGQAGIITKNALLNDSSISNKVVGFFDDNTSKIGASIEGVKVYSFKNDINKLIEKYNIDYVILAVQNISVIKKREIVEECLEMGIEIRVIPPVEAWVKGSLNVKQIKAVRMSDLLGRDPIELNVEHVSLEIEGKTILITGAAGSIGSEIVRQVLKFNPQKVLILDQAETPLFELDFALRKDLPQNTYDKCEIVVCSVVDKHRLENVFMTHAIDIIYHAAAYKHVPIIENNPIEGVKTNVVGTKNCSDLAVKYKVSKFVMVSTDKAVNPTNVMGATKRVAEKYTNTLANNKNTSFVITRFGNVLGSNGSVIPLFRKQIEEGGPILVTHKDIERYFMTIPEACQLVLEAGAMGVGGEIFVFDMGESIKIYDVAKKMIRLAGLRLGDDIEIKIIGLRPGEKLYEELLTSNENCVDTHHPKIMKALIDDDQEDVNSMIHDLIEQVFVGDNDTQVVKLLKKIVPEYLSNNSKYESLDN